MISNRSPIVSLISDATGTLAVGALLETPTDPPPSDSPLFSQGEICLRNGVLISVKMCRVNMTLCQKDTKPLSASIGHKQLLSKLNMRLHFEDYQKVSSMHRKLSLQTCDVRWRLQPRPPSHTSQ